MKTLEQLLQMVNKANKEQLRDMISDFELIGFCRSDRRQQRKFIIDCLTNCYTTELNEHGCHINDSLDMEKSVLNAQSYKRGYCKAS